jgi:hypothetical protein
MVLSQDTPRKAKGSRRWSLQTHQYIENEGFNFTGMGSRGYGYLMRVYKVDEIHTGRHLPLLSWNANLVLACLST